MIVDKIKVNQESVRKLFFYIFIFVIVNLVLEVLLVFAEDEPEDTKEIAWAEDYCRQSKNIQNILNNQHFSREMISLRQYRILSQKLITLNDPI